MRNSIGAAVLVVAAAACGRTPPDGTRAGARPNVLLVTIDTFRADRLGTGVAPAIDRLADAGIRFTSARTAAPLTLPSHTTILTGLLPPAHGVRENGIDAPSGTHATVATLLKSAGYETAAFVGAFVLDRRFGLARGFDTYDDQILRDPNATERLEAERPASAVIDRAIEWLDRRAGPSGPAGTPGPKGPSRQPFLLWIHVYDPHAPYNPPREFIQPSSREPQGPSLETRYDGEIRYADAQIARVFEWLRAHSLTDRTLVVVAGDHGEGLGDHGERTHGMLLYDSTLRVPLILSAPGHAPASRAEAVSLADLAPTLLRAAGLTPPEDLTGRDLLGEARLESGTEVRLPLVGSRDRPADLYGETEYPRVAGWSALQALTDGRWKAIQSAASTELYDLQNDPRELHDVGPTQTTVATAMAAHIASIRARGAKSSARTLPAEVSTRLRSLGYVASSVQPGAASSGPNPATAIGVWNAFEDALSALNAGAPGAVEALRTLAASHPDAPVFQTTFARALRDAGQAKSALAIYRRAAKRWPTDATLLHDLAVAARETASGARGDEARALREEASRAEQASVALAPESAIAHNGLGLLAGDEERRQDAVNHFDRATTLDPTNASYWANLGNARRAIGDRNGAEQAYRRALDVDARTVDAANGLGVLLVETQRAAEAAPWFERALAGSPDFVEARLNLGIALQQAGQPRRAAEMYRLVLNARGTHPREKEAATNLLAALGAGR